MNRVGAPALALVSGVLFGVATPASKVLVGDMGPYLLAGLLYLGAAIAMLPLLRRGRLLPTGKDTGRLVGVIALGGVLGPLLLLFGLHVAAASSVSVWLNLELAWTALLGLLVFRERASRWSWLAVAAIIAASTVIGWGDDIAGLTAGALVAAACLCWGFDNHWTATIRSIPAAAMTAWKGVVGGSVNVTLGLILGARAGPLGSVAAIGIGTVCYGISILLYVNSARIMGATRAQVLFSTAPLWGVLAAVAFLEETWSAPLAVALGLVCLAIGFLAVEARTKPTTSSVPASPP